MSINKNLLLGVGFLLSVVFSGCDNAPTMGELTVKAILTQPLGELSAGSHDLELSLPTATDPNFRLKAPEIVGRSGSSKSPKSDETSKSNEASKPNDSSADILVIPQSSLTEEPTYSTENREGVDVIKGEASNGIQIDGKLLSSLTIAVAPPNVSGHRAVSNGTLYRFSAQLTKDGQSLGEISGRKIVAW